MYLNFQPPPVPTSERRRVRGHVSKSMGVRLCSIGLTVNPRDARVSVVWRMRRLAVGNCLVGVDPAARSRMRLTDVDLFPGLIICHSVPMNSHALRWSI